MIPPTSIDGTDITGATIDGTDVQEITVDGDVVFKSSVIPNLVDIRFPMDEGSGTTLNDQFSSDTASLINGAGWDTKATATGGFRTSYDDTQSQYWISDTKLPVNETDMTLLMWFEWDGTESSGFWASIFMTPTNPTRTLADGGWAIVYDSGSSFLYINSRSGGSFTGNTSPGYKIDSNEPYFFAWTFSGNSSTYRVYENDSGLTKVYDRSLTATRGQQGTDFYLGGNGDGPLPSFGGFIDDVMVNTTTALTEQEIEDIGNETLR